jgi:hypothetical protein
VQLPAQLHAGSGPTLIVMSSGGMLQASHPPGREHLHDWLREGVDALNGRWRYVAVSVALSETTGPLRPEASSSSQA